MYPDPQVGACITTDKTAYNPGDTVHVTVNVLTKFLPSNVTKINLHQAVQIESITSPFPVVAIAPLILPTPTQGAPVDTGLVALTLPTNTTAGHYYVRILFCEELTQSGGQTQCSGWFLLFPSATIDITVIGQAVPETPSIALLLLPALLLAIYVTRCNKTRLTDRHS